VSVSATRTEHATSESLEYVSEAVAAAGVLRTAVRLGVLDQLDAGVGTAPELAAACDIGEPGAERLLSALGGLGLLELHGGRWRRRLAELSWLARLVGMWDHLDVAIRDGRPLVRADTAEGADAFYPEVAGQLGTMLGPAAERAAALLPVATHVLDAGAGAAPWSLAYAARHPSCTVTALDLPAILPVTRQAIMGAGRGPQFDFLLGDLFAVHLPHGRYDLAIAGNICHLFDDAANRRLLRILYEALAPGGVLAIADIVADCRPGSRSACLYELGLHLRTGSGGVHPLEAYRNWLAEVGFQPPEIHELLDDFPLMLIIARKPSE
jgi:SAM-dependent methyltransferase